jgi:hypothetical protein
MEKKLDADNDVPYQDTKSLPKMTYVIGLIKITEFGGNLIFAFFITLGVIFGIFSAT